jgi:hypothetical protein
VSALDHAGVAPDYRHVEKVAHSEPSLSLDGAILKWYDIAPDAEPVPLAVRAVARRCLRDAAGAGQLGSLGELGFVILHRCGDDFFFLLVCTWRNENELETVWGSARGRHSFHAWPSGGTHVRRSASGAGAVAHERRMSTSEPHRDDAACRAYLGDMRHRLTRGTLVADPRPRTLGAMQTIGIRAWARWEAPSARPRVAAHTPSRRRGRSEWTRRLAARLPCGPDTSKRSTRGCPPSIAPFEAAEAIVATSLAPPPRRAAARGRPERSPDEGARSAMRWAARTDRRRSIDHPRR